MLTGIPSALPIDLLLPEVRSSLQRTPNLVIEAAPGAGKTTRVPPVLLDLVQGEVLVLEPRRIAARLAARRAAEERGERLGETVGFQVRFEEVSGPKTRLRFVTEGVLTRRLLSDPELRGVDAVVLDEFHERHLDTDLALALLKRLQERRPDLKLVVMSATLESGPVAQFLGGCPVLRSEGRSYELTVRYLPYSASALEEQVRNTLERLLREGHTGHVLVFLPGAGEIRRALRACEGLARSADVWLLPLHGDLSPEEQDRAVGPSARQKLIFATNVAESSVTIEGVTAVIDSGLARVASYSAWSGLPTLEVARISKASAAQRAGRAGRTGPGIALRLYPQEDFARRADHDAPAVMREDLSGLLLSLRAMGIGHIRDLPWLDQPPREAVLHAEDLLDRLGIREENASRFARLPLPPRLSRVLLEAVDRQAGEDGIAIAALLGSGARPQATDLLEALDGLADPATERQKKQLWNLIRPRRQETHDDNALLMAVLAGFPDRVARLRSGKQVLLANGISAELSGDPPSYNLMVVVDAEDRKERPLPVARLTARVEPEWLLDLFPERLREDTVLEWNAAAQRVESVSTLRYDDLLLDQSRSGRVDPVAAADMLAREALETGLERFVDGEAMQQLLARIRFAGLPEPVLATELRRVCEGLKSFSELRESGSTILLNVEAEAGPSLRQLAPPSVRLPGGRVAKVQYDLDRAPWVESRLQDFFGMQETPRIGKDHTPLVVHLLAPNRRPVQTTTDLAGFWQRLYPTVRRELMRRYPRHAWPEDPTKVPVLEQKRQS